MIHVIGYRDWAKRMFSYAFGAPEPAEEFGRVIYRETPADGLEPLPDAEIYVGWSEIVPNARWLALPCYVLHPSRLPFYRGGSPIQHQIIAGETASAVSIFRIDNHAIDSGPLVYQAGYSLEGITRLSEVFDRIVLAGASGLSVIARDFREGRRPAEWPQPDGGTSFKRRTPAQSEITPGDVEQGADFVRRKMLALEPPYPAPFVTVGHMKFSIGRILE